jgi:hypothetical protein
VIGAGSLAYITSALTQYGKRSKEQRTTQRKMSGETAWGKIFIGSELALIISLSPGWRTLLTWKQIAFANQEIARRSPLGDLIFSIPNLIATISAGQTLQAGDDVLSTS